LALDMLQVFDAYQRWPIDGLQPAARILLAPAKTVCLPVGGRPHRRQPGL